MHDDSNLILPRIARLRQDHLRPALYRQTAPVEIAAWTAPGEPVPFAKAAGQAYAPVALGSAWGEPWGTVWFHVTGRVPAGWDNRIDTTTELVVDLGFAGQQPGFSAEGTAYAADGRIIKAIEPRNQTVPIAGPGEVDLFIEAAANPNVGGDWTFAPTPYGSVDTAPREPLYRLNRVELGLLDRTVWELEQDFSSLVGLTRELPEGFQRQAQVLRALDNAVDAIDPDDVAGSAAQAREVLAAVLAAPAAASAHRVHAVGHAHIDSAWLWPTRETVRKVARTFANVCDLIEQSADFVFAASSAQQYAWLKASYPELFARVKAHVATGRFVPVGGMWVESDTNMPGGEALARQFVAGKRFFLEEFGIETEEVWLPDSFGYSAGLPQIVAASGSRWFLTQKISWNQTNVMPHHTFRWEGIDGTRIFTHFPPADTYNSDLSAADLARAERQYAEKGVGTMSLVPFGFGDGGGGPTREMLAAAARAADLEGSPTVTLSSPRRFFTEAEADYPQPPVWSGELYLEFHRGTYTSQAKTKQGNRRSEHLLREAELWATTAAVRVGAAYPTEALTEAWHTVLLQQFHDILPGSSIAWVHQEAERNYAAVAEDLEAVIQSSLRALAGHGGLTVAANGAPFALGVVPALGAVAVPDSVGSAAARRVGLGYVLENSTIRVEVDQDGLVRSLYDQARDREVVPPGAAANLLQLHRDTPAKWDAWDLDQQYRRTRTDLTEAESVELIEEAESVELRIVRRFGGSRVEQTLALDAQEPVLHIRTEVDWHERQKLLKLALPFDVHAERAASEIQFGHIYRPTHVNTSWDAARFETVAHRWVHVGEATYGVAVANDSTYGHDIARFEAEDGRAAGTMVRLSLLRAPTFPDPQADQGRHTMNVSVRVGATIGDAVREGYRRNLPIRTVTNAGAEIAPLFTVDEAAIVIEAVKLAEDGSGDVVVRAYESTGARVRGTIAAHFPVQTLTETDLLERNVPAAGLLRVDGGIAQLELRPFQLITLRFARS